MENIVTRDNCAPMVAREEQYFDYREPQVFALQNYLREGDEDYLVLYRMWAKRNEGEVVYEAREEIEYVEDEDDCVACKI